MSVQELLQTGDFAFSILNAMPLPIFIVDRDVSIVEVNQEASRMLAREAGMIFRRRAGEILHCVHSTEVPEGCGRAPACKECIVRNSVTTSFNEHKTVRERVRMELVEEGKGAREIFLLLTTAPLDFGGDRFVLLILQDISELMELKRILPICCHCKKIRNDEQYWQSVEEYFSKHMDLDFSHGLCPECYEKFYPEYCE